MSYPTREEQARMADGVSTPTLRERLEKATEPDGVEPEIHPTDYGRYDGHHVEDAYAAGKHDQRVEQGADIREALALLDRCREAIRNVALAYEDDADVEPLRDGILAALDDALGSPTTAPEVSPTGSEVAIDSAAPESEVERLRAFAAEAWRIGSGEGVTHGYPFDFWWDAEGRDEAARLLRAQQAEVEGRDRDLARAHDLWVDPQAEIARLRELLAKAVTWEGRLNKAEQMSSQGPRARAEAIPTKLAVQEEIAAARAALTSKEERDG